MVDLTAFMESLNTDIANRLQAVPSHGANYERWELLIGNPPVDDICSSSGVGDIHWIYSIQSALRVGLLKLLWALLYCVVECWFSVSLLP